jgi:excisionase family DNA binding protein
VFAGVRSSPSGPLEGGKVNASVRGNPPVSVELGPYGVHDSVEREARVRGFQVVRGGGDVLTPFLHPSEKPDSVLPVVRGGEVLTVREVAALLKVSTATVYAMVERGQLEHFRVMNSIRVPRAALARLAGGAL